MDITIIEAKKVVQSDLVEVVETTHIEFETHPHELVGSVAARYAKKAGMPELPPKMAATLRDSEHRLVHPSKTVKQVSGFGPFTVTACEPWSLRGEG